MIKSLLVPLDSSSYADAATAHALAFAKPYGARVTGMYVLDIRYLEMPPYLDYSYTFEAVPPTLVPLDVMEKFRVKSERILNDFREAVGRAGLEAETRMEEGVPSQAIADAGRAHDLIVMGKRGEHAKWGRDLVGSTAENVVRRSGTPVLLVNESTLPLRRFLILFDGSHPAGRALRLGADLATHTSATLRILTADDDHARGSITQAEAEQYIERLGLQAEYTVAPGRPAKAAAAYLEEEPADLVVLGMQGHSALHDLILGSTAEHVMRSVELPVLLVP